MSDFTSEFWSWYIGGITIIGLLACVWLVIWMSKGKGPAKGEKPQTMGHVWDEDLAELNNPLPNWWKNMFYITIVFGAIYLALFPGLGSFPGLLDWTSQKSHADQVAEAEAEYGPIYDQFTKVSVKALGSNAEAMKMGERLYLTYCTACHGSDAAGVKGFPNLRDSDWLWGGTPEQIKTTILNGRAGNMPALGAPLGGEAGVKDVAQYVLSLSDRPGVDAEAAARGKAKFAVCMGCHLPTGTGNQALGAPNLTDNIWLYGGHVKDIEESISNGRKGVMPAHKEFLGEAKVHLISAYIYNLSQ